MGAAAVFYFWLEGEKPELEVPQPPAHTAEPAVSHPIEAVPPGDELSAAPPEPLPALADSDGAMRDAMAGLFGRRLEKFFNLQEIIHRFVATVDNLTRRQLPLQPMPVKRNLH